MSYSGSLIHTYVLCKRKTWLLSHQITGDQENEFLSLGRLVAESSYSRDKKEIQLGANKIDIIKGKNNCLTLIEVKKSSKMLFTSQIQLEHYLYQFSLKGYDVKGEIRIPTEKKVIEILLDREKIKNLEKIYLEIELLNEQEKAPTSNWIMACKNCSYNELCWA